MSFHRRASSLSTASQSLPKPVLDPHPWLRPDGLPSSFRCARAFKSTLHDSSPAALTINRCSHMTPVRVKGLGGHEAQPGASERLRVDAETLESGAPQGRSARAEPGQTGQMVGFDVGRHRSRRGPHVNFFSPITSHFAQGIRAWGPAGWNILRLTRRFRALRKESKLTPDCEES